MTERLIGAIVLVAVAVVVIPELLSGRGDEQSTSKPLQLPAEDDPGAVVETRTIKLDAPPAGSSAPPAEPLARAPAVGDAGAAKSPAEQSTAAAAEPPVEAPRTAAGEPAVRPAAPAPSTPAPDPAPAAADTGWAVQLGSFSEKVNAERLVKELRAAGYPAFLSQASAGGHTMHRVRVGPEQDRARAEALAARLKRDGHAGQVLSHP